MADENKQLQKLGAKEKYHIKKFLKNLESIKGRHTELISVYAPAGYDLNLIINHLSQEQGTATNIKSKSTRDNVIASLEKMLQHLKTLKHTPPNGLVTFSGNVAEREGQQDYQVWSIEPPIPMKQRLYRCDKEFVLEPLQDIINDKLFFGLVAMDKREGTIALLKGKTIVPLKNLTSAVPGKHKTGGQSAQRFERLREGEAIEFYKRIAEHMKEEFLADKENLQGIIIGGPGRTKIDFVDGGYITDQLKRKIIAVKDLSYTGDFGIQELVDKSQDVLANEELVHEKLLMQRFFELLAKRSEMVSYGQSDVMRLLKQGAVEIVILSEALDEDVINQYEEEALPLGSEVEIVSVETREGVQLRDMGKVVAILRYPVDK